MSEFDDKEQWMAARLELLKSEKAHMRAGDALAKRRRALPRLKLDKAYQFTGAEGHLGLDDLFGPHSQLVVYHFMFGVDWEEGCSSCSFWADNFDGLDAHLAARDTGFACVSKAPYAKLAAFRARMGWRFQWVSAAETDFNEDLNVSFGKDELLAKSNTYNYKTGGFNGPEAPGISTFERRSDGQILHAYSTYGRGLEAINGAYHILDLTPKGRDEAKLDWPQQWVRRHDQYDNIPNKGN
ncbi:MAG: DUF899 domain-containing protein [Albidovulum sp.]